MLLVEDRYGSPVAVEPRWWQRVLVCARSDRLDRELGHGASADSSVELAVRAEWLLRDSTRRSLTAGVERLLAVAQSAPRAGLPYAPVRRDAVRAVRPELLELRARLRDGRPVSGAGLAQATELLSDGGSPLHRGAEPSVLRMAVREVIEALDPLG